MVFILSALWWIRIRGLWKLPDGRDWLWGKLGLVLMGEAMLNKSLIQFSVDRRGCIPSLFFGLRSNYDRGNEGNSDLLQKDLCMHCCIQCPWPCNRPLSTHASIRVSWTLTGKFGSVFCGDTATFSWLLVHTRFYLCPPRVSESCGSSVIKSHWLPKSNSLRVLSPFAGYPGWEICCRS